MIATSHANLFSQGSLSITSSVLSCLGQLALAGLFSFLAFRKYVPHKRLWISLQVMFFVRGWIPGCAVVNKFHGIPETLLTMKILGDIALLVVLVIAAAEIPEFSSLLRYRGQARIDRMQDMESTQDLTHELTTLNLRKAKKALLNHVA
jgi:hypothetical protein